MKEIKERLILIGFTASGKTTQGKALAEVLNLLVFDTDEIFIRKNIYTPREYVDRYGLPAFRLEEHKIIKSLPLSSVIISIGGGALENIDNYVYLQRKSIIIYLEPSFFVLENRLLAHKNLPYFLQGAVNQRKQLRKVYQQRKKAYEAIADMRIIFDDGDIDKNTQKLLSRLNQYGK